MNATTDPLRASAAPVASWSEMNRAWMIAAIEALRARLDAHKAAASPPTPILPEPQGFTPAFLHCARVFGLTAFEREVLLLAVGALVNAYAGRLLLKYWDDFLGRIPLIKTLYGGFRDVVSLLPSGSGEKRDLQRVVLARFAGVHAIGFVTREDVPPVLNAHGGHDWVTVYFPMSYAFGGYTVYLPRDHLEHLDISVEDAMRLAITAGLTAAGKAQSQIGRASCRERV